LVVVVAGMDTVVVGMGVDSAGATPEVMKPKRHPPRKPRRIVRAAPLGVGYGSLERLTACIGAVWFIRIFSVIILWIVPY
jgi:hypothetical protein